MRRSCNELLASFTPEQDIHKHDATEAHSCVDIVAKFRHTQAYCCVKCPSHVSPLQQALAVAESRSICWRVADLLCHLHIRRCLLHTACTVGVLYQLREALKVGWEPRGHAAREWSNTHPGKLNSIELGIRGVARVGVGVAG